MTGRGRENDPRTVNHPNRFEFRVVHSDTDTAARCGVMSTPHGDVETPAFMPVATQATVKTVSPAELRECGVQIIVCNAYHLYLRPGTEVISSLGGLHRFMSWTGPMLTDSGGYQVFSLAELRRVKDEGVTFQSHLDGSYHTFTPERVMEVQASLGADIVMALDECPAYPCTRSHAEESARRSLFWAGQCREKGPAPQQALFGIVQGSVYPDLRRENATGLVELEFPGYAIGGLCLGEPKQTTTDTVAATLEVLPTDKPRYLMGAGEPPDLVESIAQGVDMFDCVIPTRNGRKGTLYTATGKLRIRNATHSKDDRPIEEGCPCPACTDFSRAYIRHLIHADEMLGQRLATLHNLTFYCRLMSAARQAVRDGRFAAWRNHFFEHWRDT
jgi:queuine tRNA-ribosyltransferase